jgi:hypothetical protein
MERKIKPEHIILFAIFLFVLGFRLYFALQNDSFNTDNAYFHLRHINHFIENKTVMTYDTLSYGGREVVYPPLFHIIMAVFSFGSIFLLKFIPELVISLMVFLVYAIAKDISSNSYAALFSSLIVSFFPLLFYETLNNLSVYCFFIPLLLLMLYSILRLDNNSYFWIFISCSFFLPLLHPYALLFIITLFVYFFLLIGGAFSVTKIKKEAALFSIFIILLLEIITYKKVLLNHGLAFLSQSIPANILADQFRNFSSFDLLIGFGILPLFLGGFGLYISFFTERKKTAYMLAAFGVSILLLLVLRFFTISIGLMFIGIVLSIFSASGFAAIYNYFIRLRFDFLRFFFVIFILVVFIFSSFIPSYAAAQKSQKVFASKIKEMKWFQFNTLPEWNVLGNPDEGNIIATVGRRKNIIDNDFILAPNPDERLNDIKTIYTTISSAVALEYIKKYDIKVIYISDDTRNIYNISNLSYASNDRCFRSVRGNRYYVVNC